MAKPIFDTHAHYTAKQFDKDRSQLLKNLPLQGVGLVVDCATDLATTRQSIALAEQYSWMYTAAGIHPQSLIDDDATTKTVFGGDWGRELEEIKPYFAHPKVVALGECGLDHHWPVPKEEQLLLFEAQILLSLELDIPMILHDREAHGEMYSLLKKHKPKGVMHSFSGSSADVSWMAKQGLYFGFTGVLTFANAEGPRKAMAAVPRERLLLETDCPYMAPVPFRGKRSDSTMITKTAEPVAKAWGCSVQEVLEQTCNNGRMLFGI